MANMINGNFSLLKDVSAEPAWMRDERLDYCDQDRGIIAGLKNLFSVIFR